MKCFRVLDTPQAKAAWKKGEKHSYDQGYPPEWVEIYIRSNGDLTPDIYPLKCRGGLYLPAALEQFITWHRNDPKAMIDPSSLVPISGLHCFPTTEGAWRYAAPVIDEDPLFVVFEGERLDGLTAEWDDGGIVPEWKALLEGPMSVGAFKKRYGLT